MGNRLAILTAQLAARPLWEKTGNPLVERNRETGCMRAIGFTTPKQVQHAMSYGMKDASDAWLRQTGREAQVNNSEHTKELATNNGWFSITPEEREANRWNKNVKLQVYSGSTHSWETCNPYGNVNPHALYRMRAI